MQSPFMRANSILHANATEIPPQDPPILRSSTLTRRQCKISRWHCLSAFCCITQRRVLASVLLLCQGALLLLSILRLFLPAAVSYSATSHATISHAAARCTRASRATVSHSAVYLLTGKISIRWLPMMGPWGVKSWQHCSHCN